MTSTRTTTTPATETSEAAGKGHRRTERTRRLAAAAFLAIATLVTAAGPASATINVYRSFEYGGDLQCGRNFVRSDLPVVASDAKDGVAISVLFQLQPNGQWAPFDFSNWRYTYFGGVTTTKVVGNQDFWWDYYDRSVRPFQSYFSDVPRGTYAIGDYIWNSNGEVRVSIAMTPDGSTSCSF